MSDYPATPVPPAPKKGRLGTLAIGGVGVVLGLLFGIFGTLAVTDDDNSSASEDTTESPIVETTEEPSEEAPDEATEFIPEPYHLTKADLDLHVKVTSKQCFGSAGCSLDYVIVPKFIGSDLSDLKSGTWDVTFKVVGGTDGPIIDTFTLDHGSYDVPEGFVDTDSQYDDLTAAVVSIDEY